MSLRNWNDLFIAVLIRKIQIVRDGLFKLHLFRATSTFKCFITVRAKRHFLHKFGTKRSWFKLLSQEDMN